MSGTPKADKNERKQALQAGKRPTVEVDDAQVRNATFAILCLEQLIDAIQARMKHAEGDEFTRLANSLSMATRALFTGHRTIAYLTGELSPMDDAEKELKELPFSED